MSIFQQRQYYRTSRDEGGPIMLPAKIARSKTAEHVFGNIENAFPPTSLEALKTVSEKVILWESMNDTQ